MLQQYIVLHNNCNHNKQLYKYFLVCTSISIIFKTSVLLLNHNRHCYCSLLLLYYTGDENLDHPVFGELLSPLYAVFNVIRNISFTFYMLYNYSTSLLYTILI